MIAKFFDGPLDGVELELAKTIDKLLIVDDDGGVVRYECDIVECLPAYAVGESAPDCVMHLTTVPADFDEEVVDILSARPRPGGNDGNE